MPHIFDCFRIRLPESEQLVYNSYVHVTDTWIISSTIPTAVVDYSCHAHRCRFVDELRNYFAKYGAVAEAMVKKDPYTGHSRGFGFVKFKDSSSVDRVQLSTCFLNIRISC